ncbi:MAG: phage antirepressor [Eubacteriales bacterium]
MNTIQIYHYENCDIRTVNRNGEPWFVAADVCRVLEIGNPTMALERLDDDEMTLSSIEGHSGQRGGAQMQNLVNEPGLYTLILGSRKPQAKAFRRWVTHEVIPSIRKRGIYATDEILADPDLLIAALQELKAERERTKRLQLTAAVQEQQIAEMQPKVNYYDLILQNKTTIPVTQIAKDYGMSGRSFNKLLNELGIQYKQHETWLLYQNYANQGYTQSHTHAIDADRIVMNTYWTQKGRLFLYNMLKRQCGILPVIERATE